MRAVLCRNFRKIQVAYSQYILSSQRISSQLRQSDHLNCKFESLYANKSNVLRKLDMKQILEQIPNSVGPERAKSHIMLYIKLFIEGEFDGCNNYDKLIKKMCPYSKDMKGIGPETVYYVAVEFGKILDMEPKALYIATGTRAAKVIQRLNLRKKTKTIYDGLYMMDKEILVNHFRVNPGDIPVGSGVTIDNFSSLSAHDLKQVISNRINFNLIWWYKQNKMKQKSRNTWSSEWVADWVCELGVKYEKYKDCFPQNGINGAVMNELTVEELANLIECSPKEHAKVIMIQWREMM